MRIVFFGTPQFAVPALRALVESRHDLVALVSQPDRPKGRGQKLQPTPTKVVAESSGTPVLQPTRLRGEEFLEAMRALAPDLGVVAAYGRILPDALLAIPRLGMINIHASLLPRYRGAAPVHRAVINGDEETGVSIMKVVTELDAGPVFAMASRSIGPLETTPEVEEGLAELGTRLLLDVIDQLDSGEPEPAPQDHTQATFAPKIERHEGLVDWTLPAARLHNLVRGLQPWPLVSAILDGIRYLIHRTEIVPGAEIAPGGTVVQSDGELLVAAGDGGVLRILQIQPEGRRAMSARDFLAGHPIPAGSRFTRP
jgi:methionyl-tRNA formyltransferase